jgi:hypothetical protein
VPSRPQPFSELSVRITNANVYQAFKLCHPVDKPKGVVKGVKVRRVAMSNSLAMSLETWRHASPLRESFSVEKELPPAIDTDERSVHD